MDKIEASTRLRALATGDKLRTDTARLRDVFEDVEAALNAGVSRANVLAELHKLGYTMTLASFKSALQRIRKERNKDKQTVSQVATYGPATTGSLNIERNGEKVEDVNKPKSVPSPELIRPPGVSSSAWNEMQAKHTKLNRK